MNATPQSLLKTVFGYSSFKPLQEQIITQVLVKKDTLVIMPTGGGKSLCYQIPALLFEGLTVVVSPLISLMKDQVEQLNELGVPATMLNSSLTDEEYSVGVEQVIKGEVKLLYVAPETLLMPRMLAILSAVPLDCLTIDEAHCISEWGHDFRPEYRQLAPFRKRFPSAVCMALTATATPRVRADIKASLGFKESDEFIASFNRENLFLEVLPKNDPISQTLEFVRRFPGQSGIIYCFSRKQVDDLSLILLQKGFSVRPYHAGLTNEERRENQELFIRDDVQIMVATIAFGMGINKPNVRFILHFDLPKSIEGYYQEIGRAGRDGLTSHCMLLFSYGDVQKLRYFIDQKEDVEQQMAVQHLRALLAYSETKTCRRVPLLGYFGEQYGEQNCAMCDNCTGSMEKPVDITTPALKFLSCVKRSGGLFGAAHIVDVLLGSENQKVIKFNHQNLSTFGIGKEYTRQQWMSIGRQLVQQGYLEQDEKYGGLSLTLSAYELFKTRQPVSGYIEAENTSARSKKGSAAKDKGLEFDSRLFEILRGFRKTLADEERVPPYVIFPDRSLMELAASLPTSPDQMEGIYGMGIHKLQKYGQLFADVIASYCEEHNLGSGHASKVRQRSSTGGKPRYLIVAEMYQGGESVTSIAAQFQVMPGTILDHLYHYVTDGYPLRVGDDLPALITASHELQAQAAMAMRDLGAEKVKPVFDALGGKVSYDELKILRLLYWLKHNQIS